VTADLTTNCPISRVRPCAHVYRGDARTSSRIQMQMAWVGAQIIDRRSRCFLRELVSYLTRGGAVVVFHGQSTLPYLLLAASLRFLSLSDCRLVYDMHDLHELPLRASFRGRLRYHVFALMEYLICKLDVKILTVSKGLARVFFKRFRRSPVVVYNVAFEVYRQGGNEGSRRLGKGAGVVYFGLIKPDRVSLSRAQEVLNTDSSLIFDIYGQVPKGAFAAYSAELDKLASKTGLRLRGVYSPEEMGFLDNYRYSWLCFESGLLNIRYCMPNKLFQSLSARLCCVTSDNLVEARALFGDACVSYSDFLRICEGKLESPADGIDWEDIEERIQKLAERSRTSFLEACSS